MKDFRMAVLLFLAIASTMFAFALIAQEVPPPAPSRAELLQRFGFVDEDGDGINDLARDSDNDGIPNCMDSDWVRPRGGSGLQMKYGYRHQNANKQGGGPYSYNYNYLWNNNGANPVICNPTDPSLNVYRNRRSNRRH